MLARTIQVKVLKETPKMVTVKLMAANSKMRVERDEFDERVEGGVYEVVG